MSHHFDTMLAKEDPSLNLCDFYLFEGAPGTTVMAITVNPDVSDTIKSVLTTKVLPCVHLDRFVCLPKECS
jgi:hypothetical protein